MAVHRKKLRGFKRFKSFLSIAMQEKIQGILKISLTIENGFPKVFFKYLF